MSFLKQDQKAGSRFQVYWSSRFNSFDGGVRGSDFYQQFYRSVFDGISALGGDSFMADGLIVWGRVIGWIRDKRYINAVLSSQPDVRDSSIAWRTHTACWASRLACNVQGDFLEVGCYEGYTASVLRDFLEEDFTVFGGKRKYFWFDRFAGGGSQKTLPLDQSSSYEKCNKRASKFSDVEVVKGDILETLVNNDSFSSRQFAFVHFDLNDFDVEFEVLKFVMKRIAKGGVLLFDDFAMVPFTEQNNSYRQYFKSLNLEVLELPTGQGLVVV